MLQLADLSIPYCLYFFGFQGNIGVATPYRTVDLVGGQTIMSSTMLRVAIGITIITCL